MQKPGSLMIWKGQLLSVTQQTNATLQIELLGVYVENRCLNIL